jgi:hypothetical protein
MLVTCPVASIKASIVTEPETRWVFAIAGYTGGTEEIKVAGFISGALLGATGCLEAEPPRAGANPAAGWLGSRFKASSVATARA